MIFPRGCLRCINLALLCVFFIAGAVQREGRNSSSRVSVASFACSLSSAHLAAWIRSHARLFFSDVDICLLAFKLNLSPFAHSSVLSVQLLRGGEEQGMMTGWALCNRGSFSSSARNPPFSSSIKLQVKADFSHSLQFSCICLNYISLYMYSNMQHSLWKVFVIFHHHHHHHSFVCLFAWLVLLCMI